MAGKPKASATRATARSKLTNSSVPVPTTGRTTRGAAKAELDAVERSSQKAESRKPLLNRENSPDTRFVEPQGKPTKAALPKNTTASRINSFRDVDVEMDREPVKAFLRIRPRAGDGEESTPYLEPISDTAVRISDPSASHPPSRLSSINGPSVYTFSRVFPPDTQQADFFQKTTLPLVRDVLEGQNGLLFTYGVTNSGKTYTIQGDTAEGSAGILPRTLDVIFNSIEGLHGDDRYHPVRLQGIEVAGESSYDSPVRNASASTTPALADILDDLPTSEIEIGNDVDPTTLKLDRNYEYTIWLSYSEVYNEKVYDLFASVESSSHSSTPAHGPASGLPRPTSTFLSLPLPSSQHHPLLLTRKALPVKPCPASDTDGSTDGAGKYIAGLRQIRVRSAQEAKALLKLGQLHRRVFGTLANSQSSRSHAIMTIKVLKVHRGERDDPTSIQTSRLTLVDLAGSERTKHTQTSGDRLREAGNINKSLMVLGQCMETLRANQRAVARSLATSGSSTGGRVDTREVKKGLAIVPFRHSKLTEVLMDYFTGEGRAVMIVNVNPYDTGYDENSHVMKFAALAREVSTNPLANIPRPPPTPRSAQFAHLAPRNGEFVPHRRKVTISTSGPGRKASETHLEVLEEDEEPGDGDRDGDDDGEPINPLVDALFDEIEMLRLRLFESEMRCAIVEAETREEVMQEMEQRMHDMEEMYTRRLMKEVEQHELKMDAKIDMLQQTFHLSRTSDVRPESEEALFEEDSSVMPTITEVSLVETEHDGHDSDSSRASSISQSDQESDPLSPLAKKNKQNAGRNLVRSSDSEEDSSRMEDDTHDTSDSSYRGSETEETGPDTSQPKVETKTKSASRVARLQKKTYAAVPEFSTESSSGNLADLEELEREMEELSLRGSPDDSIIVLPNKKSRKETGRSGGEDIGYVPKDGQVDAAPKKKRQLNKKRVVTESASQETSTDNSVFNGTKLRRSVRGKQG